MTGVAERKVGEHEAVALLLIYMFDKEGFERAKTTLSLSDEEAVRVFSSVLPIQPSTLVCAIALSFLLKNGVLSFSEEGLVVRGRGLLLVLSELAGEECARRVVDSLVGEIAASHTLLGDVLRYWDSVPSWLRLKILDSISHHGAGFVLEKFPQVVDSRSVLVKLLAKMAGEELPPSATELIATYAPDILGLSEPALEETVAGKMIRYGSALVRVDTIEAPDNESTKWFTVFDKWTKLGIAVPGRTVQEAVSTAYSSLLDAYFEFIDVVKSLDEYSRRYGVALRRKESLVGGFRLLSVEVEVGDGLRLDVPLQPEFRSGLLFLLDSMKDSGLEREREYEAA